MKNKFPLLIFSLALIFLLGSFVQVSACSCLPMSACLMYKDADAIFVGKVVGSTKTQTFEERGNYDANTNTETVAPKKVTYADGKIFFEVKEAFKGTKPDSRFTIIANTTSCGFNFEFDETYLIYASKRDDGSFTTSLCTTKYINDAAEDFEFLRNPPKVGSGTKIFGFVLESINDYSTEGISGKRAENVNIKIQSMANPKKVYFAATDADGNYQTVVPAGTYKIAPNIPTYQLSESLFNYEEDWEIVKAQDRQCENRSFHIKNNSRISGKVVDENGKPLENIEVELFPENTEPDLNARGESAETDEKGIFSFSGVPLGRYFLSINYYRMPKDEMPYLRTFYPNVAEQANAQIIGVSNGTKLNNVIFRLPAKLKKFKVEGIVTRADGTPATDAEVHLMDEELNTTDYFKKIQTDANGKFVLEGFEGRKYYVSAIVWKQDNENSKANAGQAESEVFTLDANKSDINLVLNENVPQVDLEENLSVISKLYKILFEKK